YQAQYEAKHEDQEWDCQWDGNQTLVHYFLSVDWENWDDVPKSEKDKVVKMYEHMVDVTLNLGIDLDGVARGRKGNSSPSNPSESKAHNRIFVGAPGTGKSFQLNEEVKKILGFGDAEALNHSKNVERVTFYPSYSYQQFVGTYKPWMEDNEITYKFVEGPLLRLLKKALAAKDQTFILVVEELNRAEAAAVFGDFFQLLDRDEDGKSEYGISVSEEVRAYLDDPKGNFPVGKKLYFPENFYIWATMNNADQGVNPLDTAFKRRWAFEYIGIDNGVKGLKGKVGKFWNVLRMKLNQTLRVKLHLNEDKLMGPWFMKVQKDMDKNEETFWTQFVNKVLLYLYEDAARLRRDNLFAINGASYSTLCEELKTASKGLGKCKEALKKVFDIDFNDADYPWPDSPSDESTPESDSNTEDDNDAVKDAESADNA
ncbi:MAG: AAA family ATPase, partial [bacterium]|nr:AAA family ATPase [bacterium]